MPECTTCGSHVTHEYVRVFGDNENSIDSCRNCRASTPEPDATDEEHEQLVRLEDREETGDREETEPDAAEAEGRDPSADPAEASGPSDDGDGVAEEQPGGRFGLGRLRSLFDQ